MDRDDFNLHLVRSGEQVDGVNRRFYETFQYPAAPSIISALTERCVEVKMLNQGIGSWDHSALPPDMKIWVAGCGRNQGFLTGLRFPDASVLASDLSTESLASSRQAAESLNVRNVELRHESINTTEYREQFDYVICTGVIHHNADPASPLRRLAAAMKPDGILELMVYNRYHRLLTTAFQKAIRLLGGGKGFEHEMQVVRQIRGNLGVDNILTRRLAVERSEAVAEFADTWLQPVEYSYTVESLASLLDSCGLEVVAQCVNQFDKAQGAIDWNLQFRDREIAAYYESLPELQRWAISNHLMMEKSPMLWFYCRRKDGARRRVDEKELCDQFLRLRFTPLQTKRTLWLNNGGAQYERSPAEVEFPGTHPDPLCAKVIRGISNRPRQTLGETLRAIGVGTAFPEVNALRLRLTTGEYPYLVAVQ
jgi:SAM-dependent methyltransferase